MRRSLTVFTARPDNSVESWFDSFISARPAGVRRGLRRRGNDTNLVDYQNLEPRALLAGLVEFDSGATFSSEFVELGNDAPTLVVSGDLTGVGAAERTITLSTPSGAEITSSDVTLVNANFVIPAADYSAPGTAGNGTFNLFDEGVLSVANDAWLEGNEQFSINITGVGIEVAIGNADGDASVRGGTTHDIVDNEVGVISILPGQTIDEDGTNTDVTTQLTITGSQSGTSNFSVAASANLSALVSDAATGDATSSGIRDDYDFANQVVNFGPGTVSGTTQTVTITAVDDTRVEGNEAIGVELSSLNNNYDGQVTLGSDQNVVVTDNDSATVSFVNATSNTLSEDSSLNVQVRLTPAGGATEIENDVVVDINDALTGDATSGTDYTFTSPTMLTFNGTANGGPSNHITATTSVAISTDDIVEADEIIGLSVSGVSMLDGQVTVGSQATHAITIIDNDTATLSVANVSVDEDAGTATVTVVSDKAVEGGFAVNFSTATGTADASDFAANSGTLNFAGTVGEMETFTVAITDDGIVEGSETINISLSGVNANEAANSDIVATDTALVTIVNEDETALTVENVSVNEDGTATVTVSLGSPVQGGFTVNYDTGLDTTSAGDFTQTSGTLTFAGTANETQTFNVIVSDDDIVEGAEDLNVTLSNVVPSQASAMDVDATDSAVVTIVDNDSAILTVADITVNEGDLTATVTVQVDKAVEAGFSVDYQTSEGTVGSADFTTTNGTLSFTGAANETQTFIVDITNDDIVEGNETILVALSNVLATEADPNALDSSDGATVTVTDNDFATLTIQDVIESEDTGITTVTVMVDRAVEGGFIVDFSTADNTTSPDDYTATSGSLTFAGNVGETQTFDITLNDDSIVEGAEIINVNLSNVQAGEASAAAIDATVVGDVTINNGSDRASLTVTDISVDESVGAATVTVTSDEAVEGGFVVNYETNHGFLASSNDYAAASGTLSFTGTVGEERTFVLNITGDAIVEANETINVSLFDVTATEADKNDIIDDDEGVVTITDDDVATLTVNDITFDESAGTALVTVSVDNAVQGGFDVYPSTLDGTSDNGDDYTTFGSDVLSFDGLAGEEQQFTLFITEDDVVEADEDLVIEVDDISALEVPLSSINSLDTATVTITDNDNAVVTIDNQVVNEDAGLVTVTVSVDKAVQGGFAVNYATADGSATNGTDNTPASGTLGFAGNVAESHTFTFTINDDSIVETDEILVAGITSIVPAEAMVSDFDFTDTGEIVIENNDTTTFTVGDVFVDENDGTATVSVSVDNAVQGGFSVDFYTNDMNERGIGGSNFAQEGQDYTGVMTTLDFVGSAGEIQTATITILDDTVVEADKMFFASLGEVFTSVDTDNFFYNGDGAVTISDEDTTTVTIADVQVDESAGTALVTLTLGNAVENGFGVEYSTSDGLADSTDFDSASSTLFFNGDANEQVSFSIGITSDEVVELDETLNVSITDNFAFTANVADIDVSDTAIVTIENDDDAILTVNDISVDESDGTATVSVTVDKAVQGGFVVSYQTTDDTTSVGDYTTATGALNFTGMVGETREFTFAVADDAVVEANEILNVALSNVAANQADPASIDATDGATVTIDNNDMATLSVEDIQIDEDAGTVTVTVSVDNAVEDGFSVDFGTSSGTASDGNDNATASGSLNFDGTTGEIEQFTFVINNDSIVEADETLAVVLSNLVSPEAAIAAFDITETGTVTILDNDNAALTVEDIVVDESAGVATVTVSVNNAVQGGFDVDFETMDGTAAGGVDNDITSGTLSFDGNVNETKTFDIPIFNDATVEGNETINVALLNVNPAEASALAIDETDTAEVTITDNDTATLTVENVVVNEADSTALVTVSVDAQVQGTFTVDVSTATSTADNGADLGATNETLTFDTGSQTQVSFTVPITNDDIVEADETFLVSLSNVVPSEAMSDAFNADDTAEVLIVDNDMAVVTVADINVDEDSGIATVTVEVDKAVQGGFTVNFDTSDMTGDRNSDYDAASGTLSFAGNVGETQTFQVTINDDQVVEADEQLNISLSDIMPNQAEVSDFDTTDTAMVNIIDNDSATLTIQDVEVDESVGFATVIVSVDQAVQGGFLLDFTTADGTANAADYAANAGTVEFTGTAGESQSFLFAITDDFVVETNETIDVSLTSVVPGEAEVSDFDILDTAVVTVVNNETAVVSVPSVVVNESNSTVTVDVIVDKAVQGGFDVNYATVADTASVGSDFSSVNGSLDFIGTASETQTFTLTISEDSVLELDEIINVALSNLVPGEVPSEFIDVSNVGTIEIVDDETASLSITDSVVDEDVGTVTITVMIDTAVEGGFTVDVGSVNGSGGVDGVDNSSVDSTLTFNGTANESRSFEVDITNDSIVEALETIQINIVDVVADKADTDDIATTDVSTITITDNDTAVVTVDDMTVNEADGTATVTVSVDNAVEGGFEVDYATSDGTAVGGDDNTGVNGTAVFTGSAGETQTFTVPITNDLVVEGAETINVALSGLNPTEAPTASFTFSDTAVVTIEDNDTASLTVTDVTVDEADESATVTVTLDNAVQGGFTVDYQYGDELEGGNILFFAGNVGEQQTFTVFFSDDNVVETDELLNVSLFNVTPAEASPSAFDTNDTAVVTITNDDVADLTVTDVVVNEADGTALVTVMLDNGVQEGFTVDFNVESSGDVSTTGGTLTFNGDFDETQTFEVDITDDAIVEGSESIGITLSNVQPLVVDAEDIGSTDTASVTITDNDTAVVTVDDVTVNEADGTATVTVSVDNAVQGGFEVDYATSDGTAVGGDDNTGVNGTAVFTGSVGETQTFTVPITNDLVVEGAETINVALTGINPTEASAASFTFSDTAVVTIVDNDIASLTVTDVTANEADQSVTVTVTLDNAVQGGFQVAYSEVESLSFAGTVGEQQSFTVFFDDDQVVEADETMNVNLFVTFAAEADLEAFDTTDVGLVTILDDDVAGLTVTDVSVNEADGTALVTVTVDNAVQGGFTVDYGVETSDDVSTTGGTLTFNGDVGETQTFEVDIVDDSIVESNETVGITLTNLQPLEASPEAFDASDTATISITDVDEAAVVVSDVFFNEEAGVALVEVTVNHAVSGGFSVDFATVDGTATGSVDYTSTSGTLVFAGDEGETKTFEVAINEDFDVEDSETFNIVLSNVVANAVDAERIDGTDTATGTIFDNESQTEVGESGHATNVTHEWQTITLGRSYVNPVVIAGPSSVIGENPIVVRVSNVTSNSFDIRVDEWDFLDETHAGENVDFMVFEAGTHRLADGTVITAGTKSVSSDWTQIRTGNQSGIVLTTVNTDNDSSTATIRMRNDGDNVVLRLVEEEAADDVHATETVSWVQIEVGSGNAGGMQLVAGEIGVSHGNRTINFGDGFSETPTFFADIQTFLGADPAAVRVTSIDGSAATVFLDEETSLDAEIFHTTETVGYFAMTPGVISAVTTNGGKIGETGMVSVNDQWTQVNFSQPYRNPVVVMGTSSTLDAEGATPRVRNVTATGFEVRVQEWDFLDGTHANEDISFIVMEAGLHVLEDGSTIAAGTTNDLTEKFRRVQFPIAFETTPIVLGQVVSDNDSAAVVTRQVGATPETFLVGLREEESGFIHGAEQVSWIAMEQGTGFNDTRSFEVGSTGNSVTHGNFNLSFQQDYESTPAFFAQTQSFNGGDNGVIRYQSLDENGSTIFLQEEQSADDEIFHTQEEVGYLAFEVGSIFSNARPPQGRLAPAQSFAPTSRMSDDGNQGANKDDFAMRFQSEMPETGNYSMTTSDQNGTQSGNETPTLAGSMDLGDLEKDEAFADMTSQDIDGSNIDVDLLDDLFSEDA